MGADSQSLVGDRILRGDCRKIFSGAGFAIGHAGYAKHALIANDLLARMNFSSPWDFLKTLRGELEEGGYKPERDEGATGLQVWGDTFLLVMGGGAYHIGNDFYPNEIESGFWAIGSGSEYALGAAFALRKEQPETIIREALKAACHYDTGTGGKLHVMEVQC